LLLTEANILVECEIFAYMNKFIVIIFVVLGLIGCGGGTVGTGTTGSRPYAPEGFIGRPTPIPTLPAK